jgi:hypothetical protein
VRPNEIASYIDSQMDLGVLAMQKTLGRHTATASVIFLTEGGTDLS